MGSSLWVAGDEESTSRPGVSEALCRTLGGAVSQCLGSDPSSAPSQVGQSEGAPSPMSLKAYTVEGGITGRGRWAAPLWKGAPLAGAIFSGKI